MSPLGMSLIAVELLCSPIVFYVLNRRLIRSAELFVLWSLLVLPIPVQLKLFSVGEMGEGGALGYAVFMDCLVPTAIVLVLINYRRRLSFRELFGYLIIGLAVILLSIMGGAKYPRFALVPAAVLVSVYIYVQVVVSVIPGKRVIEVLYAVFLAGVCFQFFLALLYPVLHVDKIAMAFSSSGMEWATRKGSRSASAVGTFGHPGALGIYVGIAAIFFASAWRIGYKARLSMMMVCVSIFVTVLTQSRTILVALLAAFSAVYIDVLVRLLRGAGRIIIGGLLVVVSIAGGLLVADIDLLGRVEGVSDIGKQIENRSAHIGIALEAIREHPFVGVGGNAQKSFTSQMYYSELDRDDDSFYFENPIHNMHLLLFVEYGVMGFVPGVGFCFICFVDFISR